MSSNGPLPDRTHQIVVRRLARGRRLARQRSPELYWICDASDNACIEHLEEPG